MKFKRVKIITSAPPGYSEKVRNSLGDAGAGVIGDYSFCSFSYSGTGRFKPSEKANPRIGQAGKLEEVQEVRIEVECQRVDARKVIASLKESHPYEEPPIELVPLIEESEL